jgi:murein DD-endopeptidase MepM/ murein hydrolase activator NlpD
VTLPPVRHPTLVAALAAVLTLSAVVGVASVDRGDAPPRAWLTESLPLAGSLPGATEADDGLVVWDVLSRGDTLFVALARLGVVDPAAERFLRTSRDAKPMLEAAAGAYLRAVRTVQGDLLELAYTSPAARTYVMTRDGERYRVTRSELPADTEMRYVSGTLGKSIFQSFAEADVPRPVVDQVLRIFSKQFDLHAVASELERFSVVYEDRSVGTTRKPGRVLGVELIRAGKPYRAFWFAPDGKGAGDYYGPEGFSLEREFLPAPLEFTEVTSWFGQTRQIGRRFQAAHPGIDYAAPIGTPVHATADGTVEFAGRQGGYGNLVVLKHRATLTTHYAHLSDFAPAVAVGTRIRQGELLGYVGMTGWTTGPHLHYELRIDDKPVNPEEQGIVAEGLADPGRMDAFRERTEPVARRLDLLATAAIARFE